MEAWQEKHKDLGQIHKALARTEIQVQIEGSGLKVSEGRGQEQTFGGGIKTGSGQEEGGTCV